TTSEKFGRDTFNASAWRHVTFVVDRDNMLGSLYIDGYEMAETSLGIGSLDTSNPLNIGSDGVGGNGNNSFDIADLKIWKGALSSDVVQANFTSYGVNKVDMEALNDTISKANTLIAGGLGNGFSQTDFDYLQKVFNTAAAVATTQNVKLYTQETINYYIRELSNAIFIYEKSNKTLTPAGLNVIVDSDPEVGDDPVTIANNVNKYTKELSLFPQADVMFIPGDITGGDNDVAMKGMQKIHTQLTNEGKLNNTKWYMVKGNHDGVGSQNYIPIGSAGAWNPSTNSYENHFYNSAYRVNVKGYNFVGFDGNINNSNTVGKATNLLNQIKNEADYDPTKPIFVSSHFPVGGTIWGSAWSSGASNAMGQFLANNNFSQVVYMSGHTQYDPTDERSHYQGSATFLESGASSYSSYQDDGPYGGYIEGSYGSYHTTPRIVNFLEVYGTKLIIKQYNLGTDEYVGIPSVKVVGEGKDAFTYSRSDTRDLIAPQFDEDIKIDSFNNNEVAFTINQANDNVRNFEYNIQLINKLTGKVDKSFNSLSYPMDKPYDVYRHYKFTGLSANTPYKIRVFVDDSMYNRSSQDIDFKVNTGNFKRFIAPADKSGVANGTAKTADALGLPRTLSIFTDEGVGDANVTWNVDASNYDPTVMSTQTFTVNGTLTLPTGVVNPNNVPLTTSINVEVVKSSANLALNKTITANTTHGLYKVTMANDGNLDSIWEGLNFVYPSTLTVDLGTPRSVEQVVIKLGATWGSRTQTFSVLGSSDNVTYNELAASKSYFFDPANSNIVTIPMGLATTRYVQLKFTWNDGGTNGQVAEFEVYAPISKLTSITAPAAITGVANGTAKTAAALGLPAKVALVTDTGIVDASVKWDLNSASYDPTDTTAQTFTVPGTVRLPEYVLNPNNVPMTTSISVEVVRAPNLMSITAPAAITGLA
ncbi:hypothetical protein GC098_22860, partial [Paenibacillus sp. LMG 31458]